MAGSNLDAVASLQHLAQTLAARSQLQALVNASLPGGLQVGASANSATHQLASASAGQQLATAVVAQHQRALAQQAAQQSASVAAQQLVQQVSQQSAQQVAQQLVSASAVQQLASAAQQLALPAAAHQLASASAAQQLANAVHQLAAPSVAQQSVQQAAQCLASASAVQHLASASQQLGSPPSAQQVASVVSARQLAATVAAPQLSPSCGVQQLSSATATQQLASGAVVQQLAANTAAHQLASASVLQPLLSAPVAASSASPPHVTAPPSPIRDVANSVVTPGSVSSSDHPSGDKATPDEVPKCHLHKKLNKACKFCKAHAAFQDLRSKEADQKRIAALEKLKEGSGAKLGSNLRQDDKVPIPNFVHFPAALKERILNTKFYKVTSINQEVPEVKETLFSVDSCEPELRSQNSLDMTPSDFFCSVYRLLMIKLTEGQLQGLLNNRSRWARCAGFLYVRLGVHQDRYWELLADALLDPEEFVPFPGRGGETISEGEYVEQLLTREKYCDFKLPRIEAAQRRLINERLVLYEQFRKRHVAHMEDLAHLQDPNVQVPIEVCSIDGVWSSAETAGSASSVGRRRVTVPVRFSDGVEQNVALGMVICPGKARSTSSSRAQDLTCSRGRSNEELLEEYRERQRGNAVASGKDYCKNSGRHMVHAGGVVFMGGGKRSREKDDSDSSEERRETAKKHANSRQHELKMAAIMEKYCARGAISQAKGQGDGVDGPDRLRLG